MIALFVIIMVNWKSLQSKGFSTNPIVIVMFYFF